jgi:nitronate monooxygenase
VLETETVREFERAGRPDENRPGEGETVARDAENTPVERYDDLPPIEGVEGEVAALPHYAGESVGVVADVPGAGRVVQALVSEARTALSNASGEE